MNNIKPPRSAAQVLAEIDAKNKELARLGDELMYARLVERIPVPDTLYVALHETFAPAAYVDEGQAARDATNSGRKCVAKYIYAGRVWA